MRTRDTFTPCSSAPHCVSSQAGADSSQYVQPLAFDADAEIARKALLVAIQNFDNAKVERADDRFIHATFGSTLGFVDDVTFILQPQDQVIDVKSSSRIGYYDFGVNRNRVERLREEFKAALNRA